MKRHCFCRQLFLLFSPQLLKMLKEKPRLLSWTIVAIFTNQHILTAFVVLERETSFLWHFPVQITLLSDYVFPKHSTLSLFDNLTFLHFLQGFCCCLGFLFCLWWYCFGVSVWFQVFGVVLVGWLVGFVFFFNLRI